MPQPYNLIISQGVVYHPADNLRVVRDGVLSLNEDLTRTVLSIRPNGWFTRTSGIIVPPAIFDANNLFDAVHHLINIPEGIHFPWTMIEEALRVDRFQSGNPGEYANIPTNYERFREDYERIDIGSRLWNQCVGYAGMFLANRSMRKSNVV